MYYDNQGFKSCLSNQGLNPTLYQSRQSRCQCMCTSLIDEEEEDLPTSLEPSDLICNLQKTIVPHLHGERHATHKGKLTGYHHCGGRLIMSTPHFHESLKFLMCFTCRSVSKKDKFCLCHLAQTMQQFLFILSIILYCIILAYHIIYLEAYTI